MTPKRVGERGTEEVGPLGQRVDAVLQAQGRKRAWLQQQLGVSRSTLYRMLSAKTGVTLADISRIAKVLGVAPSAITPPDFAASGQWEPEPGLPHDQAPTPAGEELATFVGGIDHFVRLLSTGTGQHLDVRSKLAILNGIEEAARLAGATLPPEFYELRRKVNEGAV